MKPATFHSLTIFPNSWNLLCRKSILKDYLKILHNVCHVGNLEPFSPHITIVSEIFMLGNGHPGLSRMSILRFKLHM